MADFDLMKKLSDAHGLAGDEQQVRDVLVDEIGNKVDAVSSDGIGSVIFELNQAGDEAPRVMLASHLDEIGWTVMSIHETGMLILKPIGGVRPLASMMQHVVVTTQSGKVYKGVLQGTFDDKFSSIRGEGGGTFNIGELPGKVYVDLGLDSADEARELGIAVGDMVTFDSLCHKMPKDGVVCGKSFDDRAGCYVMAKVMEKLSGTKLPNNVYGVGTSSEEVGVRGATTSVDVVRPDVAIVIDTNNHGDEFDRSSDNHCLVGKGPIIVQGDRRTVDSKKMVALAHEVAADLNVPYQDDIFKSGGTDAGAIMLSNGGVPVITICVPLRYIHCSYSICSLHDCDNAAKLVAEIVRRLDAKTVANMYKFV